MISSVGIYVQGGLYQGINSLQTVGRKSDTGFKTVMQFSHVSLSNLVKS